MPGEMAVSQEVLKDQSMKPAGTENRLSRQTIIRRLTPSFLSVLTLVYLLTAVWIGTWLRHFTSVHDLSPDSRDIVKQAMGLVITMSALVLGLLVDSTRSFYGSNRMRMMETVAKFSLLHRMLTIYGPQAAEVQGKLKALLAEVMRCMWSDDPDIRAGSKLTTQIGDEFYVALLKLEARDDAERVLTAQAVSLAHEIAQVRYLTQAESLPSISKPMLVMLVHWLVMIFFSTSLIAPPSGAANFALIASASCVAGAIFLILELDRPFNGFLRISSEPMVNALRQFGRG